MKGMKEKRKEVENAIRLAQKEIREWQVFLKLAEERLVVLNKLKKY